MLLGAFAVSRSCGSSGREVSQQAALEIARPEAPFRPEKTQIRFVRRGIPPRSYWAVSMYTLDARGRPERIKLVLVDARTGEIAK